MGFIQALIGGYADNAAAQHGLGQAMHSASQANTRGRIMADNHNRGIFGPTTASGPAPSDSQLLFDDAANQAGHDSVACW